MVYHQGQKLDDRWVVVRPFDLAWGRGAVVRDNLWNGAVLDMVAAPAGDDEAFLAAAQRWRALEPHPGVVAGYYVLPVAGRPCFFAQHPTGTRLDTVLAERWRPLEENDGYRLSARIATALAHLHGQGLVHGHLEPASCAVGARNTARLTRLYLAGGAANALYRAPELWSDPRPTVAGDVYALGVMIYEILAGKRPFDVTAQAREAWNAIARSATGLAWFARWIRGSRYRMPMPADLQAALGAASLDAEVETRLLQHFHQEVELPPPDMDPSLPFAVRDIVTRCLSKRPRDRPACVEVAAELQRLGRTSTEDLVLEELETAVNNNAVAYAEMGELDEARSRLDAWLDRNPASVYAWVNRALIDLVDHPEAIHQLESRFDEAVRPYHPAVDSDPDVAAFLARLRLLSVSDEGEVSAVSIRPNGRTAAVAWTSGPRVCLWDLADKRGTRMLHVGGSGRVNESVLVSGGLLLVRVGQRIAVHESESLRTVWARVLSEPIDVVGVAPNGSSAMVACGRILEHVNVANGEVISRVPLPDRAVDLLAFDAAGARVSVIIGTTHAILDAVTGEVEHSVTLDEPIVAQLFVPTRGLLATATATRVVCIDPDGGEPQRVFEAPEPITALTACADGTQLATGHPSGVTCVWALDEPGEPRVIGSGGSPVTALAFTPDGRQIIVGDKAGLARTWEVRPSRWPWLVRTVLGQQGQRPDTIHRSTQERSLILHDAGLAGGIVLAPTGTKLDWTTSYQGKITAVAMSRDGARVGVTERHSAHLSQMVGRRVHLDRQRFAHDAELLSIAFDAVGRRMVAGTGRWRARPPELPTLTQGARLSGLGTASAISHTLYAGTVTIGRSPDCGLVLDDASASRLHCTIAFHNDQFVLTDEQSANGTRVNGTPCTEAVLRDGDVVGIGATDLLFQRGGATELAATLPVPERRAGPFDGGEPTLEVDTTILDKQQLETRGADDEPTGRRAATVSPAPAKRRGCVAVIWECDTARTIQTLVGHTSPIRAVAFTRDGTRVVSASEDGTARLWNVETGAELGSFPELGGPALTSLAVSPDDAWLAVGREDGVAALWDLATGELLRELKGHRMEVSSVCFSGDGRLLATGSRDGTARVWRCWTGRTVVTCSGHTGAITEVAFSPDDRLLLTGSLDGTARLWSRLDGQLMHQIELREGVTAMDFSADGRLLVTGGEDGSIQAWLIKCVWIYLDDLVAVTEETVDDPRRGAGVWPSARRPDLDFWLDVWRDLGRCGAVEVSPDLHARYLRVRTRVLYKVVEWMRDQGLAPELTLGPRIEDPTDEHVDAPPHDSPLRAIGQADPELAAQLRMHLSR